MKMKIITALNDLMRREKPKPFMLEDSLPKTKTLVFHDHKTDIGFEAEISSIRLGQDTGMNTLIDLAQTCGDDVERSKWHHQIQ